MKCTAQFYEIYKTFTLSVKYGMLLFKVFAANMQVNNMYNMSPKPIP